MIIGLVVHPARPEAEEVGRKFVSAAGELGIEVVAAADDADQLPGVQAVDSADPDLLVSIGGDGTVLEAVQRGLVTDTPVLGINLGRVGFLAEVEQTEIPQMLKRLAAGEWEIEERMTLRADLDGGASAYALNDVVISKRVSQRLVGLSVEVDGEPFRTFRADGIVVATPTGSTAYSFSAGGPALAPSLEAIIMSAVAPHSLFSRSLIFEPDRVLRFTASSDRPIGVEVDATDFGELASGQGVTVARGDKTSRFATLGRPRFPHTLKHKLGLDGG